MAIKKATISLLLLLGATLNVFAQQQVQGQSKIEINAAPKFANVKLFIYREWPKRKLVDTIRLLPGEQVFMLKDSLPTVYTISTRKPYTSRTLLLDLQQFAQINLAETEVTVKGGSLQLAFQNHELTMLPIEKKWQELGQRYEVLKDMEQKIVAEKEIKLIQEKAEQERLKFVRENRKNVLGAWIAYNYANMWEVKSLDVLIGLFRNEPWANATTQKLLSVLQERNKVNMKGTKAPLFVLNSIIAKKVTLESMIATNDYVFIDVWASWCAPCRVANRDLVKLYPSLKKKKVAFVSVSVDDNMEAWKKAIKEDQLPWLQLLSDNAMKGDFAEKYKIKSLPSTFLIDKKGFIVAQNLKANELEKMLANEQSISITKSNKVLLKNATIIDGEARIKPRKGSVLIENGIIKTISLNKIVKWSAGTKVIDCTGKFVTPGLIDSHVHLATGDLTDLSYARSKTDSILKNLTVHGVTTVRDMAGNAPYLSYYKHQIKANKVLGPDIYYASQFAGHAYFKMIGDARKEGELAGITAWYKAIDKKEDVKQAVTEAKNAGASGIKIYADLTKDLIKEITEEAHRQNLMAWSHTAVFPSKPMDIIKIGVNSMSHAGDLVFQQIEGDTLEVGSAWSQYYKGLKLDTNVRDQMLLEMKKQQIFLDPTIYHGENNKMYEAAKFTKRAHQLGVKIVAGTDWFYPTKNEPIPLLEEMKLLMSKCGLSNLEAIEAATYNGAAAIGINDRGMVRPGKKAHLLILDEDPRRDIASLFSPKIILKETSLIIQE